MPQKKKIVGKLIHIYEKQTIDLLLFAYVVALTTHLPGVTAKQAIFEFMKYFEITEEDISFETLQMQYQRIKSDFCGGD